MVEERGSKVVESEGIEMGKIEEARGKGGGLRGEGSGERKVRDER